MNELPAGAEGEIVLDRTAFYSESGGQVSDIGTLWNNERTMQLAEVRGAYYPVSGLIAHRVIAKEKLAVGDRVAGDADGARREHIKRNHTATHLMHAALRNILGTHVKQAGSLVEPGRLRFDFSHFAAIDPAELRDIEQQVNDEILLNNEIETNIMTHRRRAGFRRAGLFRRPLSRAKRARRHHSRPRPRRAASTARSFAAARTCARTGDIGVFKIAVEQSAAAGVRRIEAITGTAALADYQRAQQLLARYFRPPGRKRRKPGARPSNARSRPSASSKSSSKPLKRKGALSKLGRSGQPGAHDQGRKSHFRAKSKAWTAKACASS